jgi:hypothetical protein
VAELQADLRRCSLVHEVDDATPRRDVLGLVHPGTARRDAPVALDVGHLGEQQRNAAPPWARAP